MLQLRFQEVQMIHDSGRDRFQDGNGVILKCTRLIVDYTIRTYDKAACTSEWNFGIAAHMGPSGDIWPGAEMRVSAEVAYDIAGPVSSNVGRINGHSLVIGGKDGDGLRADAKA